MSGSSYLLEELAKGDEDLSLSTLLIGRTRVRGHVQTGASKTASRPCDGNDVVKDNVRAFLLAAAVDSLVADGVHGTVNHATVVVNDLLDGVGLCEVDRDATDLLGGRETLRDLVDDIHLTGTPQHSTVCGHQTDRAGSEYCDCLAGLEAREH